MLDIQLLRKDLDAVMARLKTRGFNLDADQYRALEQTRKTLQVETEALQSKRNSSAKAIGQAKSRGENVES